MYIILAALIGAVLGYYFKIGVEHGAVVGFILAVITYSITVHKR